MYNVILIAVDTLRADHLSLYGYKYQTCKNLDDLSKNAIVFKNAFSCTNATDPSFTSLFTGKEPHNHGINNHGRKITQQEINYFDSHKVKWLTSVVKEHGYSTAGIDWLGRWHKRDYETYPFGILEFPESVKRKNESFRNCKAMTDRALGGMKNFREKPFFVFIHYWDVHRPYNYRSRITLRKFPNALRHVSEYDASIYYVDKQIRRIVRFLKKHNVLDKTIIVVTADHGESLGEHGIYYDHHGLYDCSMRIPLVIHMPGFSPAIVEPFVQTTDVMPTLLELLTIDFKEEEFDGLSLVPLMKGSKQHLREKVFFKETFYEKKFAVQTNRYKLIMAKNNKDATCSACHRIHGDSLLELYNLETDPDESYNIYREYPDIVAALRQDIINHFGACYAEEAEASPEDSSFNLSEERRLIEERLKGLGYF